MNVNVNDDAGAPVDANNKGGSNTAAANIYPGRFTSAGADGANDGSLWLFGSPILRRTHARQRLPLSLWVCQIQNKDSVSVWEEREKQIRSEGREQERQTRNSTRGEREQRVRCRCIKIGSKYCKLRLRSIRAHCLLLSACGPRIVRNEGASVCVYYGCCAHKKDGRNTPIEQAHCFSVSHLAYDALLLLPRAIAHYITSRQRRLT